MIGQHAIYVIEDLQTSYWTEHSSVNWGGSTDLDAPHTSMNFLKKLVDCPNYKNFEDKTTKRHFLIKIFLQFIFIQRLLLYTKTME